MPSSRNLGFTIFLALVCAALSVEVVLLVRKTRRLEEQLLARPTLGPPTIQPGEVFGPFTLLDESGVDTLVEFEEGEPRTLLLVFTLSCAACEDVIPLWAEIIPVVQNALRVLVVCLSASYDSDHMAGFALPAPIHSISPVERATFARITRVPAAIVLDDRGIVEHAWSGVPTADDEEAMRHVLATLADTFE